MSEKKTKSLNFLIYEEDHQRLNDLLDRYTRAIKAKYKGVTTNKKDTTPFMFKEMLDNFEEKYVIPSEIDAGIK